MPLYPVLFPALNLVPTELTMRDDSTMKYVGFGLFIAFVLISVAKLLKTDVFIRLFISSTKTSSLKQYLKEYYSIFELHSLLQLINYWLSFSLILYVLFDQPSFNNIDQLLFAILVPPGLFLFTTLSVFGVSLLSGEYTSLIKLFYYKVIGTHILGLSFFVLGVVWILSGNTSILFPALIILLVADFTLRILKGLASVFSEKVSAYYIILYFCTLEILPLIVFYYAYIREFQV